MKLILKEKQTYEKINVIGDLLNFIELNYGLDITFDNREVNHYKLIVNGITQSFSTYNDVISCLNFIISCDKEKVKEGGR